ncbi:MAG: sporulation protein YqfD [Desulfitobacteriaceae bacterium]|nr:sporulation protein YqfD [Desulfitobacteriaceae bacterium]MDD4346007.1 sporulation protein YqfD [Desulfitobacteriaceae bacterium]MDD4400364.1 sporulation protein YqfD [Desulfitobacteriaceae bacterium]
MFERLRAFLRGRIYFVARGERLTDFINEVLHDRIVLFQARRSEKDLRAQISPRDFVRLRRAARKSHSKIKITAKYGWPFIANRWRRRKGLLVGLFLIAAALICLSQLILSISVSGNKSLSSQAILDKAAGQGLKCWVWQRQIDPNKIADVLQEQIPEAAWIGIERKGTQIAITVVEKIRPQIPTEKGNLLAGKPGLVREIIVIQGQPQIHEGEIVRAGQLLISQDNGTITDTGQQTAAKGFVRGRVWYKGEAMVPLLEDKLVESGRQVMGRGIKIGSRVIMITNSNSPFSLVNEEVEERPLLSWRNWRFPVELINIRYKELSQVRIERSVSEARDLAENLARAEVNKKIPEGIKIVAETVREMPHTGEQAKIRVEVETYEDLAVYSDP